MKKRLLFFVSVFICAFLVTSLGTATAGNPFKTVTTTADGYPTWDSDMINIENVEQTGEGVYIAVLDTGLAPNWKDYFPRERIATKLGIGFYEALHWDPKIGDFVETGNLHKTTFIGSISSTHGTHVTSTIIGYFYDSIYDDLGGFRLPPIMVRGIAPDVTIIPVKVLADYHDGEGNVHNLGTDRMVAEGIKYVTDLKNNELSNSPVIISMSLGVPEPSPMIEEAIDEAIDAGVIVVAAAGNVGDAGMDWPGAYSQVISVGACGWTEEWLFDGDPYYHLWWLQSDLLPYNDIPEPTPLEQVYVPYWSSRQLSDQELDVLAPGSWVRGPFPGFPGYAHVPWWSNGIGEIMSGVGGNFLNVGGTSMATPHVSAIIALMLEKNPDLDQKDIESILEATALGLPEGFREVYYPGSGFDLAVWGSDAVGSGLVQADAAIADVPSS